MLKVQQGDLEFSGVTAPALVVESTQGWKFVSWQEAQYVPCWDVGDLWVTAEWFETLGNKSPYDYEPISDKGSRYTFPKLIEFGPARAVVKWSYALCDTTPEAGIFYGNTTADEYYYLYPDGFATRKLVGWPGDMNRDQGDALLWETGEIIILNPKGTVSHDHIDVEAASFSNLDGDEYILRWTKERFKHKGEELEDMAAVLAPPLCLSHPSSCRWNEYVISAHLTDRPRFFMIFPNDQKLFPHAQCTEGCEHPDHPKIQIWKNYPTWKHWPVWKDEYHIARSATEADMLSKATHTSITSIDPYMHYNLGKDPSNMQSGPFWYPDRPSTWYFLVGVCQASDGFIRDLGRSWLHPAKVQKTKSFKEYDLGERCYVFSTEGDDCTITFLPDHLLINPVVKLIGWQSVRVDVWVDAKKLSDYEFAVSKMDDGLLVWIQRSLDRKTDIRICSAGSTGAAKPS